MVGDEPDQLSKKSRLKTKRLTTMAQVALHLQADLRVQMELQAPKKLEAVTPGSLMVGVGGCVRGGGVGGAEACGGGSEWGRSSGAGELGGEVAAELAELATEMEDSDDGGDDDRDPAGAQAGKKEATAAF